MGAAIGGLHGAVHHFGAEGTNGQSRADHGPGSPTDVVLVGATAWLRALAGGCPLRHRGSSYQPVHRPGPGIRAVARSHGASAAGTPGGRLPAERPCPVSYTHLRAHETVLDLVCRLL